MVKERPTSRQEFAKINGVGAAKLKEFADPFIAEISAHRE
jgi:superfamily II DNA helicase RecQ